MFPTASNSILTTRPKIYIHIGNPGVYPACPLTATDLPLISASKIGKSMPLVYRVRAMHVRVGRPALR